MMSSLTPIAIIQSMLGQGWSCGEVKSCGEKIKTLRFLLRSGTTNRVQRKFWCNLKCTARWRCGIGNCSVSSSSWSVITTIAICQCWLLIVRSRRSQLTLSVSLLLSCLPQNCWNNPVLGILGVPKMALRVFESKFWDHFSRQTSPQKDTLWSQIGPQKVIFGHFGGTKNGTSGARIEILRPLFNTN